MVKQTAGASGEVVADGGVMDGYKDSYNRC